MGGLSGVGLSLVEVPRFRAALERRGEAFAARIFTPAELVLTARAGVEPRFAFRLSLSHDADFALASVLAEPGA